VTSKVFLRLATRLSAPPAAKGTDKTIAATTTSAVQVLLAARPVEDEDFIEPITTKKKKKKTTDFPPSTPASRFSTANIYSMLEDDTVETPVSTSIATKPDAPESIASPPSVMPVDPTKVSGLLPAWDTEFWRTYGNKLRVFGTREEVCDLTKKPKPQVAAVVDDEKNMEEEKEEEDADGGVDLGRRSSILGMLQNGVQSLWLGGKK
jgi:poly(A)-specific ribonuclease